MTIVHNKSYDNSRWTIFWLHTHIPQFHFFSFSVVVVAVGLRRPGGADTIYLTKSNSWWRHQMETFSALLAIYAGNSPVTGEFPAQRPVTRSFDVFFYLRLNERLGTQSWGWWFETPSRSLWRHCNVRTKVNCVQSSDVITRHSIIVHTAQQWMKQNLYQS